MVSSQIFLDAVAAYLNNDSLSVNISKESDWHTFMQLAQEQKLLPVIYETIHSSMPDSVASLYRRDAILQVAHQTAHTAEFLQLYDHLSRAGFRPIVVKGIICRSTYDQPDFRISSDEDIYLRPNDYIPFHKQMVKLGFQTSETPDMKNAHEERYIRNGFMIEGHWELFPKDNDALNALNQLLDDFWDRAQMITIDHVPLLALEPTDHMTFLLLHAFKHFISSGFGIRQICDIVQWSKVYDIEWNRVHDILASVHGEYFAAAVFGIGEQYFGMTYPPSWEHTDFHPLLQDSLSAGVYGSSTMSRKHSSTMTLGAVESRYRGKRYVPLLSSLFPNRSVMESSFPWVRYSHFLLPFAWGIRISRYLRERGTANTPSESIRIGSERTQLLKYYKIL